MQPDAGGGKGRVRRWVVRRVERENERIETRGTTYAVLGASHVTLGDLREACWLSFRYCGVATERLSAAKAVAAQALALRARDRGCKEVRRPPTLLALSPSSQIKLVRLYSRQDIEKVPPLPKARR